MNAFANTYYKAQNPDKRAEYVFKFPIKIPRLATGI